MVAGQVQFLRGAARVRPAGSRRQLAESTWPKSCSAQSMTLTVDRFMTPAPHTIGHTQPLSAAHRLMRLNHIRHLPVLDGGKLVGMLSERDLHFVETVPGIDPELVPVSEAMSQDVYAAAPYSPARDVARDMAHHKYGAAVVVDAGHVVGVFTTVDALRVLSDLLDEREAALNPD
jgi:acetoin utilization protein AcuB